MIENFKRFSFKKSELVVSHFIKKSMLASHQISKAKSYVPYT